MDPERLIQTAALKISSLRGAYDRNGFDIQKADPVVDQVLDRLRRFVELSHTRFEQLPVE